MNTRPALRVALTLTAFLAVAVPRAWAQAPPPTEPPQRADVDTNKSMVEQVIDVFSSPIRVLTTAVVPTSGLSIGGGILLTGQHEEFSAGAKISTRGFWRADAQLSTHPSPWSYLKIFGTMRHAPALTNYGLGPDTSKSMMAEFDLDDRTAGGGGWVRHGRFAVAANGDVTLARSGRDAKRTEDMRAAFDASHLVGLGEELTYGHASLALDFNNSTPIDSPTRGPWYRITGHKYFGVRDTELSLTVVDIDLRHYFPAPGGFVLGTQVDVKLSPAHQAAKAPFYLLPYLGGDSSLEGYVDYRFRDANTALLRLQGRKALFSAIPIWKRTNAGPFYIVGFVDAGTVAGRPRDLDFQRLHYDVGVGVSLWLGASTLLRMDFAFSPNEGFQTKPFTSSF